MDEKEIKFAEQIAYQINYYLYCNKPDFKAFCDEYINAYLHLKESAPEIKKELEKLYALMQLKIYQDTLREVLPAVHVFGYNPFFYMHEEYLLRETQIDRLIRKIRADIPEGEKTVFQRFVKSVQCMKKWYERKLNKQTLGFLDRCYKYYC